MVAPRGALRSGNQIYIGDPEAGELHIYEVQVEYSDPQGAWFRSDEVEPGQLAVTSPIQAAFDGMNITVLERMPDGSIKTHTPSRDREDDMPSEEETSTGDAVAEATDTEPANLVTGEGE